MSESLLDRIARDISSAIRAKDQRRLAPLRMLKTALVNRRIERGADLSAGDEQRVVATLVKQRHEAIEQYRRAGRGELADREAGEIEVLESYLPPPMDAAAVEAIVDAAIAETGATTARQLGTVMKLVMVRLAGRNVDGKTVSELVRSKLAG